MRGLNHQLLVPVLAASGLVLGLFALIVREAELFVAGAVWRAVAAAPISVGSWVRVTGREGGALRVERTEAEPPGPGLGS